jgi:hypothetical protein
VWNCRNCRKQFSAMTGGHEARPRRDSDGTIVADEAYIGGKSRAKHGTLSAERKRERIIPEKAAVLTLVNRETGEARSRVMARITSDNL